MQKLIIAIDGPAGSGKSTTARAVARELNYLYIDTGAMYRAVGLAVLRAACEVDDAQVSRLLSDMTIDLERSGYDQRTMLNGEDVSDAIRTQEVAEMASAVAALPSVRAALTKRQREIGRAGAVVMDGRDIGTNVFPDADVKIFMTADAAERARRRVAELQSRGQAADFDLVLAQIRERDARDAGREIAPLKRADDAVDLDTSGLGIAEQNRRVLEIVRRRMGAENL